MAHGADNWDAARFVTRYWSCGLRWCPLCALGRWLDRPGTAG